MSDLELEAILVTIRRLERDVAPYPEKSRAFLRECGLLDADGALPKEYADEPQAA